MLKTFVCCLVVSAWLVPAPGEAQTVYEPEVKLEHVEAELRHAETTVRRLKFGMLASAPSVALGITMIAAGYSRDVKCSIWLSDDHCGEIDRFQPSRRGRALRLGGTALLLGGAINFATMAMLKSSANKERRALNLERRHLSRKLELSELSVGPGGVKATFEF